MGDDASDPIDHHRATQPFAGETMKNTAKTPGLVFVAVAVVAFVICLASFAVRQTGEKIPEERQGIELGEDHVDGELSS